MKELLPLLEEMAASLGTTVEHLWTVMMRQAPISAATDLLQYGLLAIFVFCWVRVTRAWHIKIGEGKADEMNFIWIYAVWFCTGIFIVCAFSSFPMTITKIANPEYWATMEILQKISPK